MATNPEAQGFDLNRPTIVALFILIGAVTGLPTIIGAVLAYVWRGDVANAGWEESHFAYHIRGFWMTVVIVCILFLLTIVSLGLLAPLFGLVALWLVVRGVMSIAKAQRREPMPDPDTFLW